MKTPGASWLKWQLSSGLSQTCRRFAGRRASAFPQIRQSDLPVAKGQSFLRRAGASAAAGRHLHSCGLIRQVQAAFAQSDLAGVPMAITKSPVVVGWRFGFGQPKVPTLCSLRYAPDGGHLVTYPLTVATLPVKGDLTHRTGSASKAGGMR